MTADRLMTKFEIKNAIQDLKNSKAADIDNITVEMMEADINTTVDALHDIFTLIRKERILKIGQLLTDCGNWRGITLMNMMGKVIIIKRIST